MYICDSCNEPGVPACSMQATADHAADPAAACQLATALAFHTTPQLATLAAHKLPLEFGGQLRIFWTPPIAE